MKIVKIDIEQLENAGCSNGNYPKYTIFMDNGFKAHGRTCNCGRGCSGQDITPSIHAEFEDMIELTNYLVGGA